MKGWDFYQGRSEICLFFISSRKIDFKNRHFSNSSETVQKILYLPLSYISYDVISSIFDLVMSLCDARNRTTSRFSFLIGTMSKRHQNGKPEKNNKKVNLNKSKIFKEKERVEKTKKKEFKKIRNEIKTESREKSL